MLNEKQKPPILVCKSRNLKDINWVDIEVYVVLIQVQSKIYNEICTFDKKISL
jgi:hypothetical protein